MLNWNASINMVTSVWTTDEQQASKHLTFVVIRGSKTLGGCGGVCLLLKQ
jgi:hypothetical protein